jgi:hypothetical protein
MSGLMNDIRYEKIDALELKLKLTMDKDEIKKINEEIKKLDDLCKLSNRTANY